MPMRRRRRATPSSVIAPWSATREPCHTARCAGQHGRSGAPGSVGAIATQAPVPDTLTRIPPLVDVDAHVVEPADVWSSRLPARHRDVGPHVEYRPSGRPKLAGGTYEEAPGDEGPDVAWWFYEDHRYSVKRLIAAAGYPADDISMGGITFDEMRPGC